jgi:hypothetical protein
MLILDLVELDLRRFLASENPAGLDRGG